MKRGANSDQFGREPHSRIPESLIDAALDGEICDQMQNEIAHALRYDHDRRAELLETAEAVRALDLDDIPMPDMQCAVLNRLDQHDRFLPRTMRKWVRTGRMAIAAGILLGLMLVAGLQSVYPRLTTIGAQSTPVHDVATAVEEETIGVAEGVRTGVQQVRASLSPLDGLLAPSKPNAGKSFTLTLNHQVVRLSEADLEAFYAAGVGQSRERFPTQVNAQLMLVSYGGSEGQMLLNTSEKFPGRDVCVVVSQRVEREAASDERIADLP